MNHGDFVSVGGVGGHCHGGLPGMEGMRWGHLERRGVVLRREDFIPLPLSFWCIWWSEGWNLFNDRRMVNR